MSVELGVIICQWAMIVFLEIRNYHERQKILNRLMSRDFGEFASGEQVKNIKPPKEKPRNHIPI